MKRIQLFEFEDFDWLPKTIRTGVTNLIVVLHKLMGTNEVLTNLIQTAQNKSNFSQIVDLGSGSGGPMPNVIQQLNLKDNNKQTKLILTDLHPNPELVKEINNLNIDNLQYHERPINATNFTQVPEGLKTMVCSFHHMPPPIAKQILQSAQDNKQSILIYEIGENFVPTILWWLLLPLSLLILIVMTLFMTPFVKPLTFKQILFTYIIPIIPFVYAWDGQASIMRTYTFDDINTILNEIKDPNYIWTIDKAKKKNGKNLGYYIMGYTKT